MIRTLAEHWWVLLLRGLAAILFGIVAYARPGVAIAFLVLLWGAYALIDGIFEVVAGVRAKYGALILLGALGIAAGVITFLWPGVTAVTLLYIIAFWAIVAAARREIAAAIRLRKEVEGEWLWILSGACMILLGMLLMRHPEAGAVSVMWLTRRLRDGVGGPARDPRVPAEGAPGEGGGQNGVVAFAPLTLTLSPLRVERELLPRATIEISLSRRERDGVRGALPVPLDVRRDLPDHVGVREDERGAGDGEIDRVIAGGHVHPALVEALRGDGHQRRRLVLVLEHRAEQDDFRGHVRLTPSRESPASLPR